MSVVRYEPGDDRLMAPFPACTGKRALSPENAERIASNMRSRGKLARAYSCQKCRSWHVGGGRFTT